MAPLRENLEGVGKRPAPDVLRPRLDAGLLQHFAPGRLARRARPCGRAIRSPTARNPGRAARSSSSTSPSAVWTTTSTETGNFGVTAARSVERGQRGRRRPRTRRRTGARAPPRRPPPRRGCRPGCRARRHGSAAAPSNSSTWPPAVVQDRSLRQSSSASQLPPNHAGNASACAMRPMQRVLGRSRPRGRCARPAARCRASRPGFRRCGKPGTRRTWRHRSAAAGACSRAHASLFENAPEAAVMVVGVVQRTIAARDDAARAARALARRPHGVLAVPAALARAAGSFSRLPKTTPSRS